VPGDKSISPKKRGETVQLPGDQNDQIILYNDVSANHYEEFEVTKINENNKRQTRILGIDGFKIYNYTKSYKHEQAGGIYFYNINLITLQVLEICLITFSSQNSEQ